MWKSAFLQKSSNKNSKVLNVPIESYKSIFKLIRSKKDLKSKELKNKIFSYNIKTEQTEMKFKIKTGEE